MIIRPAHSVGVGIVGVPSLRRRGGLGPAVFALITLSSPGHSSIFADVGEYVYLRRTSDSVRVRTRVISKNAAAGTCVVVGDANGAHPEELTAVGFDTVVYGYDQWDGTTSETDAFNVASVAAS